MEMIVSKWDELGVLKRVLEKKLIFIETKVTALLTSRVRFVSVYLFQGSWPVTNGN